MSEKSQIQADAKSLRAAEASFEQNPDAAHLSAFQDEVDAINRKNLAKRGYAKNVQAATAEEDRKIHATTDVEIADDGSMTISLDAYGRHHAAEANRAYGLPADASIEDL